MLTDALDQLSLARTALDDPGAVLDEDVADFRRDVETELDVYGSLQGPNEYVRLAIDRIDSAIGLLRNLSSDRVTVSLMLLLEVMETLRLAHIYALKDSQPEALEEIVPDFKPHKWVGYEKAYAEKAYDQYRRLSDEIGPQVSGE